jgi:hypothetical protein
MGGGGEKGTSTVISQPAPPQIAPQFEPFAAKVGENALKHLEDFNLSDYKGNMALNVPGLNPMQRSVLDAVNFRFQHGIPTPTGEQGAASLLPWMNQVSQSQVGQTPNEQAGTQLATALPDYASQQINADPLRFLGITSAADTKNRAAQAVGPTGLEQQGTGVLGQFAGGDVGESPIITAAVERLNNIVNPMIENKMTAAGLGRSGEMLRELQEGSIAYMLPLFQQGLQQQQAAGQQLVAAGQQQAGRAENALTREMGMENLFANILNTDAAAREGLATEALNRGVNTSQTAINTLLETGGREGNRQADTINRMLQTGATSLPSLLELGERETSRDTQRLNEMLQGGALDRDIAGQIAQAEHADVLRRQALAEVFHTALLGSIPSLTTFPSTTTETTRTPSTK